MNIFNWLSVLLVLLLSPLIIIDLFFALGVMTGLRSRLMASAGTPSLLGPVVMVIPAHDEAAFIGNTVAALHGECPAGFEILVVADNCRDSTASIAQAAGAHVIERTDRDRRGKGFALAFARDWLLSRPPASVIILDADCRTDRASLTALAALSQKEGRVVQATNLLEAPANAPPMVQISTFAFLIKNLVRQRGLQRLAGGVHLTGTGMSMPWAVFRDSNLATASIVEDLRLGLELADRGIPPCLAENAFVWSAHAGADQTLGQRRRWEGGFLATMRAHAPNLLARALVTGSPRKLATALDLMVPPLALFVMINAATLALAVLLAVTGVSSWLPATLLMVAGAAAGTSLSLAWWREGRTVIAGAALLRVPPYALWKLPMYLGLPRRGAPGEWTRTARSEEP